jgi:hypothetical protein
MLFSHYLSIYFLIKGLHCNFMCPCFKNHLFALLRFPTLYWDVIQTLSLYIFSYQRAASIVITCVLVLRLINLVIRISYCLCQNVRYSAVFSLSCIFSGYRVVRYGIGFDNHLQYLSRHFIRGNLFLDFIVQWVHKV